jgi:hypothetical protein
MTNRVKNFNQLWCVYIHIIENDLVYIGSGTLQRAFDFMPDKRSPDHYKWFCDNVINTNNFVKILYTSNDYEEVRFVEGRLIAEYKPCFNKNLNKITFSDLKQARYKIDTGVSLRQCAKELQVAHNNLRVLLNSQYCNFDLNKLNRF